MGIKPTPFKYTGQTASFDDGPLETGPAGGSNGGGNAGGAGGGSSKPTTSATKGASKNAGQAFAPPRLLGGEATVLSAFVVAWVVGFVGMLWM
jgi:hypothetical protein